MRLERGQDLRPGTEVRGQKPGKHWPPPHGGVQGLEAALPGIHSTATASWAPLRPRPNWTPRRAVSWFALTRQDETSFQSKVIALPCPSGKAGGSATERRSPQAGGGEGAGTTVTEGATSPEESSLTALRRTAPSVPYLGTCHHLPSCCTVSMCSRVSLAPRTVHSG